MLARLKVLFAPLLISVGVAGGALAQDTNGIVVYQSDFGVKDGAVSAMKGVAIGVDPTLRLEDLTHEIPAFNIWEGAYRLNTTVSYWPTGTVFVSVVDPGVGTDRKSVVLKTGTGHYIVTPDNGTLTLVAESLGIEGMREIDEEVNRLPGSENSNTFHGRDIYSFTAARLASGTITFEEVGPELSGGPEMIAFQKPEATDNGVAGTIPILDVQFGNVWTNIDRGTFEKLGVALGTEMSVKIFNGETLVYDATVPYVSTFGDVPQSDPLLYFNSVDNLSVALNFDDFAGTHNVSAGPEWLVEVTK